MLKIDDKDFKASNPVFGVHSLHDLMDKEKFQIGVSMVLTKLLNERIMNETINKNERYYEGMLRMMREEDKKIYMENKVNRSYG